MFNLIFFPRYFELCLMFQKVKIVVVFLNHDVDLGSGSGKMMQILADSDPKHCSLDLLHSSEKNNSNYWQVYEDHTRYIFLNYRQCIYYFVAKLKECVDRLARLKASISKMTDSCINVKYMYTK